ncbi:MAG: hypothetical protein IJ737_01730 [Ruminococcus sp.]|nr:hypothetical protein [Ruminococcus sp.]
MRMYLIDFENVKSKGLTGIDSLSETDSVIIFYSENADTISFEMHQRVICSKAEVEYFKVHVGGKNALDFQLSTLLGYLVCRDAYSHIFVISNDKSFDYLHDFWHGKYIASPNCVVYRTRTIAQALTYESGRDKTPAEPVSVTIVAEVPDEVIAADARIEEAEETANVPAAEPETAGTAVTEEAAEEKPEEAAPATVTIIAEVSNEEAAPKKTEEKAEKAEKAESTDKINKPDSYYEEKIARRAKPAKEPKKPRGQKTYVEALREALKPADCTEEEITAVAQMLAESEDKEEFHNTMAKEFKQRATDFYKLLRPKYLRLRGLYEKENPSAKKTPDEEPKIFDLLSLGSDKKDFVDDLEARNSKKEPEKTEAVIAEEKAAPEKAEEIKEPQPEAAPETEAAETVHTDVISQRLYELLAGLCSEGEFEKVRELFDAASTKQQLYIRMVKVFKKDKGCQFYNAIKAEYDDLRSKAR